VGTDVTEYTDVNEWMNQVSDRSRVFLMSSHAEKSLDIEFQDGDWLVFGKERGLEPRSIGFICHKENQLKIPCHL
jgi:tRNA (cytidine/uridine-2'-O-)-methyltransferase